MRSGRVHYLFIALIFALLEALSSCRKDSAINGMDSEKASSKTDSAILSSVVSSPGNFLASSGTLKVKINDSIFTFDATRDSIAFINVHLNGTEKYYGITAINKEHTMSFGISSSGYVGSNTSNSIAGSQFLLAPDEHTPVQEYSLSKYTGEKDFGNLNIAQYNQGKQLAKGTFVTFLAKDNKANSPFYRVEGSFDLQVK